MSNVMQEASGENWSAYLGDSAEVMNGIKSESIHMSVFSPPFSSLYTYSNSERDLGNCRTDAEFYAHFNFIIAELYRVLMPGRHVVFHCMNIPAMKERDGYIGLKDFRGDLIRAFQKVGFIFHSETVIWKDPLIEATRTKALGLMHKQLCKDSCMCRSGIPDFMVAMRKPGINPEPVAHQNGLEWFVGEDPPLHGNLSHERWRRYASPVWMDIRQTRTLNAKAARQKEDERHICPLPLDDIERSLQLWSNPKDAVFSPFMGIGSEGYVSLELGRRFIGIELKQSYFDQAVRNLRDMETMGPAQLSLLSEATA